MIMNARTLGLLLIALALGVTGCGDDDGTAVDAGRATDGATADDAGTTTDGAVTIRCPEATPALSPPCCYRTSNADRTDAPELRLNGLRIEKPTTLGNPIVGGIIQTAFDGETFNWLLRMDLGSTPATLETGYGRRNADGTFNFAAGDAPTPPDDATRWDPITIEGAVSGETVTATTNETVILPIVSGDGTMVLLELPLRTLEVSATLTEDRTCVGTRRRSDYETSSGSLVTYVEVEAAAERRVDVDPINTFLCNFIGGVADSETPCTEIDRGEWDNLPDALCDADGCVAGGCDPMTDCNAWELTAGFAAAGVEIQ
jgi:hypothetical protein